MPTAPIDWRGECQRALLGNIQQTPVTRQAAEFGQYVPMRVFPSHCGGRARCPYFQHLRRITCGGEGNRRIFGKD